MVLQCVDLGGCQLLQKVERDDGSIVYRSYCFQPSLVVPPRGVVTVWSKCGVKNPPQTDFVSCETKHWNACSYTVLASPNDDVRPSSCNTLINTDGFKILFSVRRRHRGRPFARGFHQFIMIGGKPGRRGKDKVGELVGSVVSMCSVNGELVADHCKALKTWCASTTRLGSRGVARGGGMR